MPKLIFEPPKIDKEKIISNIFGDEVYLTTFSANSDQYGSQMQQLIFLKGNQKGIVKYKGSNEKYFRKNLIWKKLKELVKSL